MQLFTKNHLKHILFSIFLFSGLLFNSGTLYAQSALGQLEQMAGQRIQDVRVPESNGPTPEERAEWAAERRDARLAAKRVQGINDNKLGNKEYENNNFKGAIEYYKKALRSLPDDEVIKNNLKAAERNFAYYKGIEESNKEFAKKKQPLLEAFTQPAKLQDISKDQVQAFRDNTNIKRNNIGEGTVPKGQDVSVGGLTEAEWSQARECQKQLDLLSKKWPLSAEEIATYDSNLAKRNALWARAISIPGITGEERNRLRIKLYTKDVHAGEPYPMVITNEKFKDLSPTPPPLPFTETAPEKLSPDKASPIDLKLFGEYTTAKTDALVEVLATEHAENSFEGEGMEHLIGVGRIAIAYKQDGLASAVAATGDYLVGIIPIPNASMTVELGRKYANTAFKMQNDFMRQAMQMTGTKFDEEKFWEDFDKDNGICVKAVREWVGYGSK